MLMKLVWFASISIAICSAYNGKAYFDIGPAHKSLKDAKPMHNSIEEEVAQCCGPVDLKQQWDNCDKMVKNHVGNMTKGQCALVIYTSYAYKPVNSELRQWYDDPNNMKLSWYWFTRLLLEQVECKNTPLDVYRGEHFYTTVKYKPGDVLYANEFQSSSLSKAVAQRFAQGGGTIWTIKTNCYINATKYSIATEEVELTIPAGDQFKVIQVIQPTATYNYSQYILERINN